MNAWKTKIEQFFELSLDKRSQEVEEKRQGRAIILGARRLTDGRMLVEGSKDVYYLRAGINDIPVCFCLDSHRGRDRCKHVLAAMRALGHREYGASWTWKVAAPLANTATTFEKILNKYKNDPEAGFMTSSEASWILSWPKLTLDKLTQAIEAEPNVLLCLGAMRFQEGARSQKLRNIIWDKVTGESSGGMDKWAVVVVGRMLPWMSADECARSWAWMKDLANESDLSAILAAAGSDTARRIPRSDLVDLMRSKESTVRERVARGLRRTNDPVTITLGEGQRVAKRRVASKKACI